MSEPIELHEQLFIIAEAVAEQGAPQVNLGVPVANEAAAAADEDVEMEFETLEWLFETLGAHAHLVAVDDYGELLR
jgi:hypothetical protein